MPINTDISIKIVDTPFHRDEPVKESPFDRYTRLATIIIGQTLLAATIISLAAVIFTPSPISATILAISAIALTLLLLKEILPLVIPHLPEPLRTAANYIWGGVTELAAVIYSAAVYPLGLINNDPTSLPPDTKKATLLVHGFLHNRSGWYYMEDRLKAENIGPIFTVNLGSPFHTIEENAAIVAKRVAEIKEMARTEILEIDIVAHSMGGPISSEFVSQLDPNSGIKVKSITTLGSPLAVSGAPIANIARFCPCANQMRPGSECLVNLNKKIQKVTGTKFFHLGFGVDLVVPPKSTFFEFNKSNYKLFTHLGHLGALYSKPVADSVINAIRS